MDHNLIKNIKSKDLITAKKQITEKLTQRMAERLADKKSEVANRLSRKD